MADPRSIRRLAFQALFQLDARGSDHAEEVRLWLERMEGFSTHQRDDAFALAHAAFDRRHKADAEVQELAPDWPTHRQPAVDRAILRLGHFEITTGRVDAKIAINEAVELAKEFSTDRSPAFVNGVLDRILKRTMGLSPEPLVQADIETPNGEATDLPSNPQSVEDRS